MGKAAAIREAACNRASLWTGIVLVLLTGIARNYDQNFVLESPFWLIGPLAFSFFSGSFLYLILIRWFGKYESSDGQRNESRWATFMALFWLTAPIAWLYAIPVERFMDSYQAAQANITLLAIVSVWRVLLMSRVISVLLEVPFPRALGWVLVGACLEVLVVFFLGFFFGGALSQGILRGMSGMRNAPEEDLLGSVLGFVCTSSWVVLILNVIALAVKRSQGAVQPLPNLSPGRVPWPLLGALMVIWVAMAIVPQREQQRFAKHAALMEKAAYADAMAYLTKHRQSDFPPGRRLEPNPYEYRVWRDLPPTVALLTPNTPPWIRQTYLSHLTATLSHRYPSYDSLTNLAVMVMTLEQLPEGRNWLQTNQNALTKQILLVTEDSTNTVENAARSNVFNALARMGMTKTNLSQLSPE
ncbi:MAG TPA: hypothetical protein VF773_21685 [Verrucomicrobiae bacterium]